MDQGGLGSSKALLGPPAAVDPPPPPHTHCFWSSHKQFNMAQSPEQVQVTSDEETQKMLEKAKVASPPCWAALGTVLAASAAR